MGNGAVINDNISFGKEELIFHHALVNMDIPFNYIVIGSPTKTIFKDNPTKNYINNIPTHNNVF